MILAFQQRLDPLDNTILWSNVWSTILAAVPVVTLFWLLVMRRWLAPKAAACGALVAFLIAVIVYQMPPVMAGMAFVHGAAFGLLPVGFTIFNTMLLYNITVETGHFVTVRRSVSDLSADARIQAILIGFAFGAFLEGAAGGGTPVAICGAILVGLGFDPFLAAVLCLIANTSPVAYGGLGTPLITLSGVTDIPTETLSIMAGHQLPILSFIIPTYMVRCMCGWRQTYEVWPALLVSGGSFALFQLTFATIHAYLPRLVLYPMTDIGGGIFSLILTGIFLKFWKPKNEWHFTSESTVKTQEAPLSVWQKTVAWAPYAVMSVFLLLTGFVRQAEGTGPVRMGPIQTNYMIPIPGLHKESYRDARLLEEGRERLPEKAEFNFAWLTNPGTPVLLAALISMAMLRMTAGQIRRVFQRTFIQMKIPIPTIACMLGLSYITRYAGMDATLGIAFAQTALLYPFFAAILGWLGVFLTGTDAGSNALFGSLQKITATEIFNNHPSVFAELSRQQLQVLITTANSTGGVMGKMIDAQSICVATAATNQIGKEADIFKAVLWHSIILASVVGLITLLQAYVHPFSLLVPAVRGP
ncbi:MAG TPA: L-lactate permease [Gemmataceae bacterium]|jgi:lactate permease|nr:L-lactate permease [Gemmataceae bacterium]